MKFTSLLFGIIFLLFGCNSGKQSQDEIVNEQNETNTKVKVQVSTFEDLTNLDLDVIDWDSLSRDDINTNSIDIDNLNEEDAGKLLSLLVYTAGKSMPIEVETDVKNYIRNAEICDSEVVFSVEISGLKLRSRETLEQWKESIRSENLKKPNMGLYLLKVLNNVEDMNNLIIPKLTLKSRKELRLQLVDTSKNGRIAGGIISEKVIRGFYKI